MKFEAWGPLWRLSHAEPEEDGFEDDGFAEDGLANSPTPRRLRLWPPLSCGTMAYFLHPIVEIVFPPSVKNEAERNTMLLSCLYSWREPSLCFRRGEPALYVVHPAPVSAPAVHRPQPTRANVPNMP